jgi:transcriptional regulator with XRE-family HTH domain
MAKQKSTDYNSTFARNLRECLEKHPLTGERTTYGKLGGILNVKPQSVSQWALGETTPDMKHIAPMAAYFGVDCNFLLTGVSAENQTIWQELGLRENSVRYLRQLRKLADDGESNAAAMILITDLFFRSGTLLSFYDMLNQYVYDVLESNEQFERDKAAALALKDSDDNDEIIRAMNRVAMHENNVEYIWYKSAVKVKDVMQMLIDRGGGFERMAEVCFQSQGRILKAPKGFEDLSDGSMGNTGGLTFKGTADLSGDNAEVFDVEIIARLKPTGEQLTFRLSELTGWDDCSVYINGKTRLISGDGRQISPDVEILSVDIVPISTAAQ